jgi:hypothetical protein
MATAIADRPIGYIEGDHLYTLEEIKNRLRLGKAALRTARRRGLLVRRIGRRGYVLGKDVIAYVEASATVEEN